MINVDEQGRRDFNLLTREEFKKQVFAKTNGKCCVLGCSCEAVDAHHIMDRKLWNDGGYYLSNGAPLCEKHHLDAEHGIITPRQCFMYINQDPYKTNEPDKLKNDLTYTEYMSLLLSDKLNKFGE